VKHPLRPFPLLVLAAVMAAGCGKQTESPVLVRSSTLPVSATGASGTGSATAANGAAGAPGDSTGRPEVISGADLSAGVSRPGEVGGSTGAPGSSGGPSDAALDGPVPSMAPLTVYFVDTEGGQATVFQLPNRQLLMIDSGNAGMRDGERILAVLRDEIGASTLDYLLITHYDSDHVGGVPYLSSRIAIAQYFDHGDAGAPAQYLAAANAAARRSLVVGDELSLGGVTLSVVSSAGNVLTEPLPGAGAANPFCDGALAALPNDPVDENVNSLGVVLRFGDFEMLDLGDLLWSREHQLACPRNLLGPIDLYLTTHHGTLRSGAPQLVRAVDPLAAIMNDGPRKGGGGSTWDTLALAPGGSEVWQLHRALAAPDDQNAPPDQIANLLEGQGDAALYLKVIVESSGQFSIVNPRTGYSKAYTARP
jgi:competence protein ComEC